jgi:hypothetical protein
LLNNSRNKTLPSPPRPPAGHVISFFVIIYNLKINRISFACPNTPVNITLFCSYARYATRIKPPKATTPDPLASTRPVLGELEGIDVPCRLGELVGVVGLWLGANVEGLRLGANVEGVRVVGCIVIGTVGLLEGACEVGCNVVGAVGLVEGSAVWPVNRTGDAH